MTVSAKEKIKAVKRNRKYLGWGNGAIFNTAGKIDFNEKVIFDAILIKT